MIYRCRYEKDSMDSHREDEGGVVLEKSKVNTSRFNFVTDGVNKLNHVFQVKKFFNRSGS